MIAARVARGQDNTREPLFRSKKLRSLGRPLIIDAIDTVCIKHKVTVKMSARAARVLLRGTFSFGK